MLQLHKGTHRKKKEKKKKSKSPPFLTEFSGFSQGLDLCQPNSSGCTKNKFVAVFSHERRNHRLSPLPRLFHHCGWSNLNPSSHCEFFSKKNSNKHNKDKKGKTYEKNSNPLLKKGLYVSIYRNISIFLLVWHCKSLEFQ